MKKNNSNSQPVLFKIVMLTAGLLAGFIIVKVLFFKMSINTDSMNPAMKSGDTILVSKTSGIMKGDIIAFYSPAEEGRILVSRVLASEYQTVEIRNKIVYVNDVKTDIISRSESGENTIYPMKFSYRDNMPPVKLERNEYFVLGDNFDRSFDSRSFGKIARSSIVGKVIYTY